MIPTIKLIPSQIKNTFSKKKKKTYFAWGKVYDEKGEKMVFSFTPKR